MRKLLTLLFLAVPAAVFAQPAPAAPDYADLAAQAINALVVIAVPMVVFGIKLLLPKIPRAVLPFLALGAGNLLQFISTLTPAGGKWSPVIASLLGAAGLWLREIVSTLKEHGMDKVGVVLLAILPMGLYGCATTCDPNKKPECPGGQAVCLPNNSWVCVPIPEPAPVAAYDCDNPAAAKLKGLVKIKNSVPGKYIVVLKDRIKGARTALEARAVSAEALAVSARFPQLREVTALRSLGALVAKTDARTARAMAADPGVAFVQEVGRFFAKAMPWHLDRVDQRDLPLDGAFAPGVTGAGIDLFVIDTGCPSTDLKTCRQDHPEFGSRMAAESWSAITYQGVYDGHGHGTFCQGEIAGKTWGVLKEATIHSARVLGADGSGTTDGVIGGIDFMVAFKDADPTRRVVGSMSLGGEPDPALDQAVCNAIGHGVQVAVAAGNETASAYTSSPARVKQAITVGASDDQDHYASFSNYGPGIDVFAPGACVTSTTPDGGTASCWDGTSMATPIVAAVAGACLERHPEYTPAQVEACVKGNATPGKIGTAPADTTQALLYVKE
jgi:hypothetical protein